VTTFSASLMLTLGDFQPPVGWKVPNFTVADGFRLAGSDPAGAVDLSPSYRTAIFVTY
jgi:hypothetical protein